MRSENNVQNGRKDNKDEEGKKEKTYGIKHWRRVRSIPRIHTRLQRYNAEMGGDARRACRRNRAAGADRQPTAARS
eukprot:3537954-Pleurochrysis_carterae.AAC.1